MSYTEHRFEHPALSGDFVIVATSIDRIILDGSSNGKTIVIDGVPHSGRITLVRDPDSGEFFFDSLAQYAEVALTKKWIEGTHNRDAFKNATPTRFKKFKAAAVTVVNAWVEAQPEQFAKAVYDAADFQVQVLRSRKASKEAEIRKLQGDLVAIEDDTRKAVDARIAADNLVRRTQTVSA